MARGGARGFFVGFRGGAKHFFGAVRGANLFFCPPDVIFISDDHIINATSLMLSLSHVLGCSSLDGRLPVRWE